MHKLVWSVIGVMFALAMLAATSSVNGQHMRTLKGEPGKIWLLSEVGGAITTSGEITKVEFVSPPEGRPAAYKSVDLQEGDIIAMVAGKKVTQASDIEKVYETLKVGEELKLGIKRGTEMKIVTVVKADPKDLPRRKMVIGGGHGGAEVAGGEMKRELKVPEGATNPTALMSAGLLVAEKNGAVIVIDVMPHGQSLYAADAVKAEDIITTFQGKPLTSAKAIADELDKANIGDKITMFISRGGKETSVTFEKTDAEGDLVIKRN